MIDLQPVDLPGWELVGTGLSDLAQGRRTIASLLVLVGRPRLTRLGVSVPHLALEDYPETLLYLALREAHRDDAHARYNSLIRRLVSFERALEQRS